MKHQGTVALFSERLLLRRFTIQDADAMYRNWASDPDVTRFLTWPPHQSIAKSEQLLRAWEAGYDVPSFYQWAIVPKALGEPIGSISVVSTDSNTDTLEIGYCIGKKWWHQGYASEALRTVIPFLFRQVKAGRLEARHDRQNPHSGDVMKKCGLSFEGLLRRAAWNNRGIVDIAVYSMLAEDFEALNEQ